MTPLPSQAFPEPMDLTQRPSATVPSFTHDAPTIPTPAIDCTAGPSALPAPTPQRALAPSAPTAPAISTTSLTKIPLIIGQEPVTLRGFSAYPYSRPTENGPTYPLPPPPPPQLYMLADGTHPLVFNTPQYPDGSSNAFHIYPETPLLIPADSSKQTIMAFHNTPLTKNVPYSCHLYPRAQFPHIHCDFGCIDFRISVVPKESTP